MSDRVVLGGGHRRFRGHRSGVHADRREAPEFQTFHGMHGADPDSVGRGGAGGADGDAGSTQCLSRRPHQMAVACGHADGVGLDPGIKPSGDLLTEVGVLGGAVRMRGDNRPTSVHGRAVAVQIVRLIVETGGRDAGQQSD